MQAVPFFVGYDPREAAAYHVFCQSVIDHSSLPVAFIPLHRPLLANFDGQRDGTTAFIYSRFLIPYLQLYRGWALFADGDMVCHADIAELWGLRDRFLFNTACAVVKHDYRTKYARKFIGTPMEAENRSYPRKNWSSLVLWNCAHYANRILTPDFVGKASGEFLHQFQWLKDEQIGALDPAWNVLVGEQPIEGAKLLHYTLGVPGIPHYATCEAAEHWYGARVRAMHLEA